MTGRSSPARSSARFVRRSGRFPWAGRPRGAGARTGGGRPRGRQSARRVTAQDARAMPPATENTAGQAPIFFASGCDPANAAT